MTAQDIVLYSIPALPLIIALTALGRYLGMPSQYAPLLALALGIAAGEAVQVHAAQTGAVADYLFGAVEGIVAGLSASGLYSHAAAFVSVGTPASGATMPGSATPLAPSSGGMASPLQIQTNFPPVT